MKGGLDMLVLMAFAGVACAQEQIDHGDTGQETVTEEQVQNVEEKVDVISEKMDEKLEKMDEQLKAADELIEKLKENIKEQEVKTEVEVSVRPMDDHCSTIVDPDDKRECFATINEHEQAQTVIDEQASMIMKALLDPTKPAPVY